MVQVLCLWLKFEKHRTWKSARPQEITRFEWRWTLTTYFCTRPYDIKKLSKLIAIMLICNVPLIRDWNKTCESETPDSFSETLVFVPMTRPSETSQVQYIFSNEPTEGLVTALNSLTGWYMANKKVLTTPESLFHPRKCIRTTHISKYNTWSPFKIHYIQSVSHIIHDSIMICQITGLFTPLNS